MIIHFIMEMGMQIITYSYMLFVCKGTRSAIKRIEVFSVRYCIEYYEVIGVTY